jgi:hypothetical protein
MERGWDMTTAQKIKTALAYRNMKVSEMARRIGSYTNAFTQRLETGKFTQEELEKMAEVLEAKYHSYFEFPDGFRTENVKIEEIQLPKKDVKEGKV